MNDQQIRSILAKRAAQEKREKTQVAQEKRRREQQKRTVHAMHIVAKSL